MADLRPAATEIVAKIISGQSALRHPNQPNTHLALPGLTPGKHQPPEIAQATNQLTKALAEAIIDTTLKQLDAELIPTPELEQLRTQAANQPAQHVTVQCEHRELIQLAIPPGAATANINCAALRRNLGECEPT